jgi:hypothetical protein
LVEVSNIVVKPKNVGRCNGGVDVIRVDTNGEVVREQMIPSRIAASRSAEENATLE